MLEVEQVPWARCLKVVVPINRFNFLTQSLGMYAFLSISVPEFQILKSMTIVMVLVFAWLLVTEKVSRLLVCSVLVIAGGVCLSAAYGNDSKVGGGHSATNTLIGVVLMLLASTFEATKTVISQVLMEKMPLFDGIYHSSPAFVLLAAVFVGCMEAKHIYHYEVSGSVVGLLAANAMATGVIVLSSFWFLKLAGALSSHAEGRHVCALHRPHVLDVLLRGVLQRPAVRRHHGHPDGHGHVGLREAGPEGRGDHGRDQVLGKDTTLPRAARAISGLLGIRAKCTFA
ncbi:unnamed protein product [Prorocentrum cordatum]|uniref:Sugar phosphate transporter domain-containing protein n=1 Tax=Prorocentrum cordatum TaxID=2364126 RepID=A0ABN9XQM3_9DINO|nr:unnamed protein product [Polarella glacialis]